MKESVTKFNLEAAFKALDEIEIPVARKGIAANKVNLKETFNRKSKLDLLLEDYYDVNDTEELEAAKEAREAEVAKAKLARIEKIVDLNAESEEDLLPSYVGKMIIQCPQCMTLFYKNEEDIARSEEDPEVVNVNEICQHCGNASGYSVIGKVDQVGEEEAEEFDLDAFEDENELDLDFPEGTEEVDPEGTGEDARDDELDLEPVNVEDEEETTEEDSEEAEEEVKESLHEDFDEEFLDEEEVEISEEELEDEEIEETEEVDEEEKIVISAEEIKDIAAEAGEEVAEVVKENPEVEAEEIKEITDEVVDNALEVEDETEEVIEDEVSEEEVVEESLNEESPKTITIRKPGTKDEVIEVPVVNGYAEYKDENGNIKKVPVAEALTEAKTTKQRLTVIEPGYQYKDKDGNLYTLYGEEVEEDDTGITYDWEFVDDENGDIYIKLVESLTEDATKEVKIAKFGDYPVDNKKVKIAGFVDCSGSNGKDSIKNQINILKNAGVTEIYYFSDKVYTTPESAWRDGRTIYSGIRGWVENNPEAKAIVTTDSDIDFNDGHKIKGHDRIEIIRIDVKEALTEAVDKELDDKLKAHNEYIEYLKEMIEKEEKSLANAKNDFVKKSIQSRIDALKADLEAALPEALKNEVVADELPTPEESGLEDAAENKEEKDEEVKESLNENVIININVEGEKEEAPVIIPVEANVETGCLPEAECPVEPIVEPQPEIVEEPAEEVETEVEISEEELEDEEIIEEACEPLTEEDNFDLSDAEAEELFNSDEFKQPISEEEVEGYLDEANTFESVFEEIDELDDESIQNCICESLTEVYSNVENFVMESCEMDNGTFKINGTINFKSGNTSATSYVFNEAKYITEDRIVLNGINETLSKDGNFVLEARVNPVNKSMVANTLSYSYKINNNLVEGLIKNNK